MSEDRFARERDNLVRRIDDVFGSVSRTGGVSWSESVIIDLYWGAEEAQREARLKDRDTHWRQLVDDENWSLGSGVGGFSFLDAKGFAYYLPAAMMRCVRSGYDEGVAFFLDPGLSKECDKQARCLDQWAELTLPQRQCVAAFLRYMALVDKTCKDDWTKPVTRYWAQFD